MGAYAGPDVSENGLVLALDAGNTKSYDKFENLVTDVATDYNYTFAGQLIATALDIAPDGDYVLCKHDLTGATSPYLNCRANTTLSAGQTYTMSMWLKGTTSFSASFAFVGETTSEIYANTANITTSWNRFTLTFTLTNTQTSSRLQVFFATQGNDKVISVWGAQLERGSEATDYTTRTSGVAKLRGTTWTDLSGIGNTGTLVNGVGYNGSNLGSLSFDGTNDYVSIPNPITSSQPYSVIQWIKPNVALPDTTSSGSRKTPLVGPGPVWNPGYWLTARVFRVHAQTEYRDVTINWVGDTGWHQVGQIFDGTTCYTVIDGNILLGTRTGYNPPVPSTILIGAETTTGSGVNWNGNVGRTTFYNRALTAQEIQQNYIATKSRFGL